MTCLPGRTASSSGAQDRRYGESSPCLYPNICPAEINFWKTSCLGFFPVAVRWVIHSLATLSFLNLGRNSYCTGEKMEDQFLCLFTSLWFSRINHVTNISFLMHKDACAMSSSSQQAQSVSNPGLALEQRLLRKQAKLPVFFGRCFVITQDCLHHLGH